MARQQVSMSLILILATILYTYTSTATAQSSDCTKIIISMSPCLDYISGNSTTPSAACCYQLKIALRSQPECLCQVLNINQSQALTLPRACNVDTHSPTQCNGASSPSESLGSAPDSPLGGNGNSSSDAASNKMGVTVLFSILLVASLF